MKCQGNIAGMSHRTKQKKKNGVRKSQNVIII